VATLQRVAACALAAGAIGFLGWRCFGAPDVPFLTGPHWTTDARTVDAKVQQWGAMRVPRATFTRRFELAAAPERAPLAVAAGRAHRVRVNGSEAWSSPDPDPRWRRATEGDIARLLRAGANTLEIEVWNRLGPPLLNARLELPGATLHSDAQWSVAVDGAAAQAAVAADDTRPHPSAIAGPRPARVARERWTALLGIGLASALACWAAGDALRGRERLAPAAALALVHALWLVAFATKLVHVPLEVGFDARNHLLYVDFLAAHGRVPLPSDGWSMYHPPLYYALVLGARRLATPLGEPWASAAVKSISFAAGLAQSWIALGLARVLAPGRPLLAAVAVLFAGLVPLNGIVASAISNEPLHAALFGAALLLAVRALARPALRRRDAAAIGAVLGVALLAKMTALVAVAAIGGVGLARAAVVERARPARLAALALTFAAPIAALAGWFFARNLSHYGVLAVGNWNLPDSPWWSQPGFHTARYFARFGAVLVQPLFAGFASFADALYSSFWGDGWLSGRAGVGFRPEHWNWDFAALGYWLALPATAVLGVGIAASARRAFAPDALSRSAWSLVLLLEAAVGFALLSLTIELPYFGQAKAAYALGLVAPLALQFALGAEACDRALARWGGSGAALVLRALLLAAGVVFALAFAA
jgi:hypothetical protein